jgi:hypothetical protein
MFGLIKTLFAYVVKMDDSVDLCAKLAGQTIESSHFEDIVELYCPFKEGVEGSFGDVLKGILKSYYKKEMFVLKPRGLSIGKIGVQSSSTFITIHSINKCK